MTNYNGFPATYVPQDQMLQYYYQPTSTYPQQYYSGVTQQPYQRQTIQNSQAYEQKQQQVSNTAIIWVQGEAGAKSYIVPPNTTVPLWDSEEQVIYIKSVDSSGKPSMTILDYVDRNAEKVNKQDDVPEVQYAMKDQYDTLNKQLIEIKKQLNELTTKSYQNNNNRKVNNK